MFFFNCTSTNKRDSPRPKKTAFSLSPPFPSHMISLSLASLEKKKYPQPQIYTNYLQPKPILIKSKNYSTKPKKLNTVHTLFTTNIHF